MALLRALVLIVVVGVILAVVRFAVLWYRERNEPKSK